MTAQEPLREGEIVTLERTMDYGDATVFTRIEGTLRKMMAGDRFYLAGHAVQVDAEGWTIVSRRDPEPEWADADAILVEYHDGSRFAWAKKPDGTFEGMSPAAVLKKVGSDLTSFKRIVGGLYLRPTDD